MIERVKLKRGAVQITVVRFRLDEVAVHVTGDDGLTTLLCSTAPLRACALEFAGEFCGGQIVARIGQMLVPLHPGEAAPVAELLQAKVPRSKAPR